MVVGTLQVTLYIPESHSLKQKRGVVKKILERSRSRFNVACAEVDLNDLHQKAVLGFTTVSNDARLANSALDKIVDFIESLFLAQIIDHRIEMITVKSNRNWE